MDLQDWGTVAGIVGGAVAIASGVAKLILTPMERRLERLEQVVDDDRQKSSERFDDFRERYVRHSEMNGHITHLDKSIDEVKSDVRSIRDLMQDFLKNANSR